MENTQSLDIVCYCVVFELFEQKLLKCIWLYMLLAYSNLCILKMRWIQNLSQKICYFGEQVFFFFLFPQKMRGYGFFPGKEKSGLIKEDPLKFSAKSR